VPDSATLARPWLQHYPPSVPATIDISVYPSLVDLLEASWHRHAQSDAAECMGVRLKFREVDELSHALAAWFQSKGLSKGDRVAVMMPNLPQYMVAIGAILRAGGIVVNVNPLYTPRELKHQLSDSGTTWRRWPTRTSIFTTRRPLAWRAAMSTIAWAIDSRYCG